MDACPYLYIKNNSNKIKTWAAHAKQNKIH
jgi:hypothetical protein